MNHNYRIFAILDIVLILLILAGSIAALPLIRDQEPGIVEVFREDKLLAIYPLNENRRFSVSGTISQVDIEIRDGYAGVISSVCPHRVCVRTPPVRLNGSQIVCVPNKIVVMIKAKSTGEAMDAVAR